MPTGGRTGFGTLIERGDGVAAPNETFTPIPETLDISGLGFSLDTTDGTNQQSTNGVEEVIPGILKTGTVDFDIQYIRGNVQHQGLITDCKSKTLRNFKLVLPDDPNNPIVFAAYVTKAQPKYPVAGKRTYSISLKPTGDVTGV